MSRRRLNFITAPLSRRRRRRRVSVRQVSPLQGKQIFVLNSALRLSPPRALSRTRIRGVPNAPRLSRVE